MGHGTESREATPPVGEPPWVELPDEELLALRICDLGARIEGSELEPRIADFHQELAARGLSFRPTCYLGDEWFSPDGSPLIAVPFFLAHPRLKALEQRQMLEVEGGSPEGCRKLLRHECGHAIDHAYRFSARREWQRIFGSPETEYTPETYRPRPYSRSFVRHLDNWYAQAHPEEDFAETFAVWLGSAAEEWGRRYRGWKALEKLEYVEALMKEAAQAPPRVATGRRISDAAKLRRTLGRYYAAKRRLYAEDFPDFYDADLRRIFSGGGTAGEPAARFMRRHRRAIIASIVHWTGQRKYTVDMLVRKLAGRCAKLGLRAPAEPERLSWELSAYLTALVTNYLHTGKFKRSV
jgi:hypothetical protein